MNANHYDPTSEVLPPGRYGNVLVLPHCGPTNVSEEEMTWPIVAAKSNCKVHYFGDPSHITSPESVNGPNIQNAVDEYLANHEQVLSQLTEPHRAKVLELCRGLTSVIAVCLDTNRQGKH